jgi:predicted Rossmann fold nucleotide-binding protein DprA/Smf involved in DNA uptake
MRWQYVLPHAEERTDMASEADANAALLAQLVRPRTVDELAAGSRAGAAEISAQLMLLELQGVVERGAGGTYTAVRTRATSNRRE